MFVLTLSRSNLNNLCFFWTLEIINYQITETVIYYETGPSIILEKNWAVTKLGALPGIHVRPRKGFVTTWKIFRAQLQA